MPCSHCGQRKTATPKPTSITTETTTIEAPVVAAKTDKVDPSLVVPKSKTRELVKVRYYGGGAATKRSGIGCRACGGAGANAYTTVTTETIMFVSEDSPNSIFKREFHIGHDYMVTRNQADYLLSLTYRARTGNEQHKFKEIK